jgi:uncharacterized protein (DUF433 family)
MREHRVSFQELRKTADELVRRGYEHWADLRLYVIKKKVYFQAPGTNDAEGVFSGQFAMVPIIDVIHDVEVRVEQLRKRDPNKIGQVERHKYIVRNAPVVAGTRIPTATIRRFYEAGYSRDQILQEYPTLTAQDVDAAIAYEHRLARSA